MHEDSILTPVVIVVGLMFVAAVTALVVRRLRFPYTIGLLIVGIALGLAAAHIEAAAPLRQVQLTYDLILYLILPTLLFEAAINIDARILLERLVPILVLAVPGVGTRPHRQVDTGRTPELHRWLGVGNDLGKL